MNIARITKHLFTGRRTLRKAFPPASLKAIEAAIKAAESNHSGEIRFVVEASLDGPELLRNLSARERAIDVFSQLRIWDTEHNNGVLVYLLLADRDIEIVADRGIHTRVGESEWSGICRQMEAHLTEERYTHGITHGIQAIAAHLLKHFSSAQDNNEIPDQPIVL